MVAARDREHLDVWMAVPVSMRCSSLTSVVTWSAALPVQRGSAARYWGRRFPATATGASLRTSASVGRRRAPDLRADETEAGLRDLAAGRTSDQMATPLRHRGQV